MRELGKAFEPAQFENEIYEAWEKSGAFEAKDENAPGQSAFCMMIPPPNVTGSLHIGHALTDTIQDILVRWRRMKGDNALWMPGTDHAGIATQTQVEKQIAKEGKGPSGRPLTRHDLGREKFIERVWKWKEEKGGTITSQMRRMGVSVDWKRERFTMDEGLSKAVREVFVRLYEEGLIYRGERIVNWCPRCQTALSDLEVIPTERKGSFWHLKYAVEGSDEFLVIATTRPETLLGDTAVAVHPDDERYAHLHGKRVKLPLLGRTIPIIADAYVDREFGTGALKLTPAHDFNDNELGRKHGLPNIAVMGRDGRITSAGGPYAGLKYFAPAGQVSEARERVVLDLKTAGLLVKTEDHRNSVGLCERCDTPAEPMMSKQWFVKIQPLADPAIAAVREGKIEFSPKSWEKVYFEWMLNIRDWCISRQLWWGHQIPAWYCGRCQEITVARETPAACCKCKAPSSELKRDEDVLDTWFSSGLWPFSTLGWPEKTKALATFYPTSILETGFDIIFFWVARMIMMGIHFMGDVPFRKVYLHAMVRDEKGEKMSKTKGNVIDPVELIDKHGADPLRFTLASMAGQGRDIKLSVDRVEGYRAYCNKLWNAVKFYHHQCAMPGMPPAPETTADGYATWFERNRAELLPANRWILLRLMHVVEAVERGFSSFELDASARALYEFTWGELCDWYIEFAKLPLREAGAERDQTLHTLAYVLDILLRLQHPIMPFVTEELWRTLPGRAGRLLIREPFPKSNPAFADRETEATIAALRAIIEAIRNFRGENGISPKVEFAVGYRARTTAAAAFIRLHDQEIRALARVSRLDRVEDENAPADGFAVIPLASPPLDLRIALAGLVDAGAEKQRLAKEMERVESDLAHVQRKLGQDTFLAKAPPELVNKERAKQTELEAKRDELRKALARLAP